MFRDTIDVHRSNVKDTDVRNPGHMESAFRKNITNYIENLIIPANAEFDEFVTDGRFKVRVTMFIPESKKTNGAIVFAHGGGYVAGSVRMYSNFLKWLADETGTRVFAPNYRLAPRRMWPGQFDEAMETISYVYDHAEDFDVERKKIIVSGEGIGATITYAAGLQLSSNGRKVSIDRY